MRRVLAGAALAAFTLFAPAPAQAICAAGAVCALDGCHGGVSVCPLAESCTGAVNVCPAADAEDCHGSVDVCAVPCVSRACFAPGH